MKSVVIGSKAAGQANMVKKALVTDIAACPFLHQLNDNSECKSKQY